VNVFRISPPLFSRSPGSRDQNTFLSFFFERFLYCQRTAMRTTRPAQPSLSSLLQERCNCPPLFLPLTLFSSSTRWEDGIFWFPSLFPFPREEYFFVFFLVRERDCESTTASVAVLLLLESCLIFPPALAKENNTRVVSLIHGSAPLPLPSRDRPGRK